MAIAMKNWYMIRGLKYENTKKDIYIYMQKTYKEN